jgi:hypothetical protein
MLNGSPDNCCSLVACYAPKAASPSSEGAGTHAEGPWSTFSNMIGYGNCTKLHQGFQ